LTDPDGLVVRSRLHQLLGEAVLCPLTHVVAPAGSGKTSLLATWCATLSTPHVWLSVDEEDRDAMRFWSAMLVALETLAQAFSRYHVHHVPEEVGAGSGGVNADDVGVLEPGDGAGLGQEAAGDAVVGGELGVNDLHGNGPVERGVDGPEDDAHAAAPELVLEVVLGSQCRLQAAHQIGNLLHRGYSGGECSAQALRVAAVIRSANIRLGTTGRFKV